MVNKITDDEHTNSGEKTNLSNNGNFRNNEKKEKAKIVESPGGEQNVDCINSAIVQSKNNTLYLEIEDKMQMVTTVDEKYTKLEKVNENRKSPSIWVQYTQAQIDHANLDSQQQNDEVRRPRQGMGWGWGGQGGNDDGALLDYDPRSRNSFVKHVFCIVFVMLIITAGIVAIILTNETLRDLFAEFNLMIIIVATILLITMSFVMTCSACARHPPCNYISLFFVTIATSILVGVITNRLKTHILLYALAATIAVVFVCILLACSNFDFTKYYIYLVAIATVFAVISLIIFITMLTMNIRYKPLSIVMLFVGSLISVAALIMELQMVLGGRSIELHESDYALGAYLLYTSIVDIFLRFAQMMDLFED